MQTLENTLNLKSRENEMLKEIQILITALHSHNF